MPQEDRSLSIYLLEKKITDCLKEKSETRKALSEARYDIEGETLRTNTAFSRKYLRHGQAGGSPKWAT
jgi:hypothetical protein